MVRKLAENKPKPSKLCSSLCNCEQHLILSALQCSLWQSHQALFQQPMIFYLFRGIVLCFWLQVIDETEFYCSGNTVIAL